MGRSDESAADHVTVAAEVMRDTDETAVALNRPPVTSPELAWSSEAETDETAESAERTNWRWRLRWASLVALVCVMALATGWLSLALYREDFTHSIPHAPPAPVKTVPMPRAAPAPTPIKPVSIAPLPPAQHEVPPAPPPVTVTSPPPSVAAPSAPPRLPAPPAHAYDLYVQLLARDGIVPTDSPEEMHDQAYWLCLAVSTGDTAAVNSFIDKSEQQDTLLSPAQVRAMLADAVDAYCPEYGNG
ncbi:MAG: DUF732 domain-containing protein [Mycobacterium sp.]|uniref:DUF732 domain-containing protein n=1 Tax=Mycobacterium sp. TaxID=1785 RepID=UPI00261E9C9E|nr:DUF732 domain-containing protein [Mycobacterium sp.]MDI3314515.1 DUF732 domain-containing protein [Mycobacterium sp.]